MTAQTTHRDWPLVLRLAAMWVIYAGGTNAAGWGLSLLGQLNPGGYLIAAIPVTTLAAVTWISTRSSSKIHCHSKSYRRALKTPSFAGWLVVTALALAGGMLNPPSNYDALTYRIPRLLYWLQEGHWHWIGALNFRMDIAGTGFEWMSAPFFVFGNGERALFLLNFIPFLLLPGLFFIAATGLGVSPRNARWWMWVWPLSYGIILQAASIGNDMIGAALGLASLAFTMQARRSSPLLALLFSALAAAAMTSIKVTMLPLGLPLAVAWIWVCIKRLGVLKTSALGTFAAILLIPSSFAPVAVLCTKNTGRWSGNPDNKLNIEVTNPVAGIVVNGFDFALGAIAPPILPGSSTAENWIAVISDQSRVIRWAISCYPGYHHPQLGEIPIEEGSGIGIGVTILSLLWIGLAFPRKTGGSIARDRLGIWIASASIIASLSFLAKVAGNCAPRLMLPFTPFFLLAILTLATSTRHKLLKSRLALLPTFLILPAIFLNPNRPLIESRWLVSIPGFPASLKTRIEQVFAAYSQRGEILAPITANIPPDQAVGFAGELDHSPLGLFRPFGSRHVVEVTPASINDLNWIVATPRGIKSRLGITQQEWSSQGDFRLEFQMSLVSRARSGAETWQLYHRCDQARH